ncbi:hypothetical protein PYH37_001114 [Sinorhizobium numidicum]|uniref:Uncharacterized protein n=1 Tax=Sinorhizobium numidicum TaxID=680248 RepID=A0ABY8CM63_9HYPH|nr:hypothetical protein [Sinorhizobium numidicum]WEX73776.1 hypothetical protein PYH37_001114 [Sinorhizobium numidicum]WEX79761.1 hypothetical protein PYH38_001115 [Sinorhizobium numidicum]
MKPDTKKRRSEIALRDWEESRGGKDLATSVSSASASMALELASIAVDRSNFRKASGVPVLKRLDYAFELKRIKRNIAIVPYK